MSDFHRFSIDKEMNLLKEMVDKLAYGAVNELRLFGVNVFQVTRFCDPFYVYEKASNDPTGFIKTDKKLIKIVEVWLEEEKEFGCVLTRAHPTLSLFDHSILKPDDSIDN